MILNVAFSSDDNYAKFMSVAISSLLITNSDDFETINIYVIDNNISFEHKNQLKIIVKNFNCTITFLLLDEMTKELNISTTFSKSSYGRIFLSQLNNVDKILYIDSDTVINNSFISLWKENIDEYLLCGVQDTPAKFYLTSIGLNEKIRYINAGVLLINLKKWRELNIEKKCIEFIEKYNGDVPHHDQGTINAICEKYIKILPAKYNVMNTMFAFKANQLKKMYDITNYYEQYEIDESLNNPVVIHFTEEIYGRPWNQNSTHTKKEVFLNHYFKLYPNVRLANDNLSKYGIIEKFIYNNFPFCIFKTFIKLIFTRMKIRFYLKKKARR